MLKAKKKKQDHKVQEIYWISPAVRLYCSDLAILLQKVVFDDVESACWAILYKNHAITFSGKHLLVISLSYIDKNHLLCDKKKCDSLLKEFVNYFTLFVSC